MALLGAKSLRHVLQALVFAGELRLDARVFIAFYEVARKKFYLEALNFFLSVLPLRPFSLLGGILLEFPTSLILR